MDIQFGIHRLQIMIISLKDGEPKIHKVPTIPIMQEAIITAQVHHPALMVQVALKIYNPMQSKKE